MQQRDSIKQSLLKLAEIVERTAHDKNGATRLRFLAEAVEANAAEWANKDIYQIVNPEMIAERYRSRYASFIGNLVAVLELLRNILIFAPIIVTWYGISQATAAYHALLGSHPDQVSQPFLYLWEQGFGGRLPSWLVLSNIGWIDASILAAIFIITIIAFFCARIDNTRKERAALELQENLTHVISGAALSLSSPPVQSFHNANTALEEAAKQLLTRTTQVTDGFNDLLNMTSKKMEEMTQNLANRLDTLANEMGKKFTAISQEITNQLQAGNSYLAQLQRFAASTDQLVKEMRASAQSLQQVNQDLIRSIDGLADPAKVLAEQQKTLMKTTDTAVTVLQGAAGALVDIGQKQSLWSDRFNHSLESVEHVLERAQDMTTRISSFTSQQHVFITELQQERAAQTQLAEMVTEATEGVQKALEALMDESQILRHISVDTRDLYETYSKIAQSNLSDLVESDAGAAQTIEKAGDSLQIAASAIFKASRALENAAFDQNQQGSPIN